MSFGLPRLTDILRMSRNNKTIVKHRLLTGVRALLRLAPV